MSSTEERRDTIAAAFQQRYGHSADTWVRAPGRVDLMGSHTDYNEGSVLTVSIDRDTWIAARKRNDGRIRLASMNSTGIYEFDKDNSIDKRVEGWGLYVQGVAIVFAEAGYEVTGCDALVHGTVPLSSGLSSSASLEVAFGILLQTLGGYTIDPVELAKLCQRAENQIVGVSCGILDQYSSAVGELHKVLVLDCRHLTHTYASYPQDLRTVICNTSAPRSLADSTFGQLRAHCEEAAAYFATIGPSICALRDVSIEFFSEHEAKLPDIVAKRARFIIEENARVAMLQQALESDDRDAIYSITAQSFAGARDLYQICIPAMEAMMKSMLDAPGVVGARQAGAGFGGCMVAFVEREQTDDFAIAVEKNYPTATGMQPEIYISSTSPGAGMLG